MKKIVVVGGGPAGLFAAISCSGNNEVVVLEKKGKPGRKLLITGSGQCNITHKSPPEDFLSKYGDKGKFLRKSLYTWQSKDVMDFFRNRGVSLSSTPEGKVFPKSGQASQILQVLLEECRKKKVKIIPHHEVENIDTDNLRFTVHCSGNQKIKSDFVIITTGGKSYPLTGSTGDGYKLAKKLGHSIIMPKPALAGIRVTDHFMSTLSGVSFKNIKMEIWRDGKKLLTHQDDMVITHKGFSGPVILNRSRFMESGDIISFDFSGMGDAFQKNLKKNIQENGKLHISTLLKNYDIPKNLVSLLLKKTGVDGSKKSGETGKKDLKIIAEWFSEAKFKVRSKDDFNKAMVTAGGVSTREINPSTMESRKVKGLFFAGEVMDVDGDTGGFNLQAAFSTAYIAGLEILKRC